MQCLENNKQSAVDTRWKDTGPRLGPGGRVTNGFLEK